MNFSDLSLINVQNPLVVSNGLVGYWSFNDGSGKTAIDFSGTRNNGSLSGTSPAWVNGIAGSALSFTNLAHFVSVPTNTTITPASLSICGWFKASSYSALTVIMAKQRALPSGANAGSYGFVFRTVPSRMTFGICDAADSEHYATSSLQATGVWQHWVGTFDDTTKAQSLYLNGVLSQTVTTNITIGHSTNNPLLIGEYVLNLFPFSGVIDEVRLYNRAITAAEVQQLYLARGT